MTYLAAGFPCCVVQHDFQPPRQATRRHNFHCPYCVNESLRRDGLHLPQEIMRTALRHAEYRFSISGGEVTFYLRREEMLARIVGQFPARSRVNLLTSGSAGVQRLHKLLEVAGDLACRLIIAIHLGQTNIKELARKLHIFLMERKQHFHVKLVVPPADPRAAEALALLDAADIVCTRHAVIDFSTDKRRKALLPRSLMPLRRGMALPFSIVMSALTGSRMSAFWKACATTCFITQACIARRADVPSNWTNTVTSPRGSSADACPTPFWKGTLSRIPTL